VERLVMTTGAEQECNCDEKPKLKASRSKDLGRCAHLHFAASVDRRRAKKTQNGQMSNSNVPSLVLRQEVEHGLLALIFQDVTKE